MSEKTEKHEYTESTENDLYWVLPLLAVASLGWCGKSDTTLEKEVSELKGKVDVIERLVCK